MWLERGLEEAEAGGVRGRRNAWSCEAYGVQRELEGEEGRAIGGRRIALPLAPRPYQITLGFNHFRALGERLHVLRSLKAESTVS